MNLHNSCQRAFWWRILFIGNKDNWSNLDWFRWEPTCKLFVVVKDTLLTFFSIFVVAFVVLSAKVNVYLIFGISLRSSYGMLVNDSPTVKCTGLNHMGHLIQRGFEFSTPSSWDRTVVNSLYVSKLLPVICFRCYLTDFTLPPTDHQREEQKVSWTYIVFHCW